MSATLEDSANALLVPAGSRIITSKDLRYIRRLMRIYGGIEWSGKIQAGKTMLEKKR